MRKACLNSIYEVAKTDERVVFIGSDIGCGTLDQFKEEMPERFFMEGVSEAHLIGMMSGMAMSGKIPFLNTIATFLTRRPYEQILLDGGLHNTQIRLIGSGGGVVYGPLGPTHLALDDIALMRLIPNMTVVAPCDAEEMQRLIPKTLTYPGPMYIRLGRGGDSVVSSSEQTFEIGKGILLQEGRDALIVSTGVTTQIALDAAKELKKGGLSCDVLHLHTLKPIDEVLLKERMSKTNCIVTIEEHTLIGGLGSVVAHHLAQCNFDQAKFFYSIGFPDCFPHSYVTQSTLFEEYEITSANICSKVKQALLGSHKVKEARKG